MNHLLTTLRLKLFTPAQRQSVIDDRLQINTQVLPDNCKISRGQYHSIADCLRFMVLIVCSL